MAIQETKIISCSCKSDFQDQQYGKGNRVHNMSPDGKKAYCTICVGSGRLAKSNSKASPPTSSRSFKAA